MVYLSKKEKKLHMVLRCLKLHCLTALVKFLYLNQLRTMILIINDCIQCECCFF